MLAHGCHLIDTARYLAGEIIAVDARLSERAGMWCWFVAVDFSSGAIGHLDLTIQVRMDWHEGFNIYGRNGSVVGKTYNPWFFKSSDVDIFREADGSYHRLEGFARTILDGAPMEGANVDDGLASVQAMVAIAQSARTRKPVALADVSGGLS
jgi:predicted dehydrogenase